MQQIEINKLFELDYHSSEAYKSLRTNVQFCGEDVKVIALTSCTPNEGKSKVSFQLALSMADDGKKVLFVDADIRKSVIIGRHKISAKNAKGLTHYLSGQNHLNEVICNTNIENLDLIMTGPVPPNPSELLGGKYFKEMIATQREKYDVIIVDTPPLGSVIDSAIIARQCDGVILVVAAEEVSYKFALKVKDQLDVANCKILGVVLNKVKIKSGGKYGKYGKYYGKYYGRYYGRYYGHYYGNEEEKK